LADKLNAILDYAKGVPTVGQELHKVYAMVNEISDRLAVIEHVVRTRIGNKALEAEDRLS
jgi:hypothetical protein